MQIQPQKSQLSQFLIVWLETSVIASWARETNDRNSGEAVSVIWNLSTRDGSSALFLMTGFGHDPLQAVLFKPLKVDQLLAEVNKTLQVAPVKK